MELRVLGPWEMRDADGHTAMLPIRLRMLLTAGGEHESLVAELWELANQFPARELVWQQLITALYRSELALLDELLATDPLPTPTIG